MLTVIKEIYSKEKVVLVESQRVRSLGLYNFRVRAAEMAAKKGLTEADRKNGLEEG